MNMSDKSRPRIISANSQTVFERYEMPNVKTRQQQKQEQAGIVTAKQLEDLQKQAYDEGFKQGHDEGRKAGLEKGLEEGRQKGLQNGQEEVAHTIKRFEQIMQLLNEPLEQVNQQVEDELLTLALAIAKQIIRREINTNPDQVIAVIKEAIAALPSGSRKIKIFLHPADAEIARTHLQMSSEDETKEQTWSIIEEPILAKGGCRIETENSRVDATIETRVAEIAAVIMGSERAGSRIEDNITDDDQNDSPQHETSHESREA
jgi:flagellar assembly protein FliH